MGGRLGKGEFSHLSGEVMEIKGRGWLALGKGFRWEELQRGCMRDFGFMGVSGVLGFVRCWRHAVGEGC